MSRHLHSEEFVAGVEGGLAADRRQHLAGCPQCRSELAQLEALLKEVSDVAVPEPSPLFWEHFGDRVKQATAEVARPESRAVFAWIWKPLSAAAALAGIATAVVMWPPGVTLRTPETSVAVHGPAVPALASDDDGTWDLVVGLAADVEWTDVSQAVVPRAGTADGLIDELTAEQREALVRLLQAEIGDSE